MIIDSHCHAWKHWPYQSENTHNPDEPPVPNPEIYGNIDQLIYEMDRNKVDQATVVCAQIWHNTNNNDYLADNARKYPGKIHQYADVDSYWSDTYHKAGAAKRLEKAAEQWPIKGFTHYLGEDDGSWMHSQEGQDFFRVASELKLVASIAGAPNHHTYLRKVAERYPDLPILSHHMAGLKCTEREPYENINNVMESSKLPNIFLKLSGFYYVQNSPSKWEYPYSDAMWVYKKAYESFGAKMVWGSDFPVAKLATTYRQTLENFRSHCDFVSEEDKMQILGGTLSKILSWARNPV